MKTIPICFCLNPPGKEAIKQVSVSYFDGH